MQLFSFNLGKLYRDILPGDQENSDQRQSAVERKLSGREKCFKRCFISPGEYETHLKKLMRKIIVARFLKYSQGEMKQDPRWLEI